MVTPKEIRKKAENLYADFLRAHLRGDSFFPRVLPCRKSPDHEAGIVGAMDAVRALRAGSKESTGFGYTIGWREVNSRQYGRNLFPDVIRIDSAADFLRFIDKEKEFQAFERAAEQVTSSLPELREWVERNPKAILTLAGEVDGLIEVVTYLKVNPRPDVFVRELPLPVDTKFIERHREVLRKWLDLVLPPSAIRADEDHFERRYGLRYAEPHVFIRFLDAGPQRRCGYPCDVLSLPLHTFAHLPLEGINIIIVENKVNLLTLPRLRSTVAVGGMGRGVTLLRYCPWLAKASVVYWGDIDTEGLSILSDLKSLFPTVRSAMMDTKTLRAHEGLLGKGSGMRVPLPALLADGEADAFNLCVEKNLRLEQERIPQASVVEALVPLFEGSTALKLHWKGCDLPQGGVDHENSSSG